MTEAAIPITLPIELPVALAEVWSLGLVLLGTVSSPPVQVPTSGLPLNILGVALLPLLLFVSGLCSASETALFSLTHADRLRLRRTHPTVHAAAQELLAEPRALLVAVLLLNVTVNTLYFTLAGLISKRLVSDDPVWVIVFGALGVLLMVLFGEILPKAIASVHRVYVCRLIAVPVLAWYRLIGPLRVIMDRLVIAPLARLFRPAGKGEPERLSTDELSRLLDVGQSQGVIAADEQQLLADVVQLGTLRVKDIMCPRVDIAWLDATATSQELLALARDSGYTRFPICRGALNDRQIVGVVHVQRVLPHLHKAGAGARLPLAGLVEPARFVPERARVDQLLDHFRNTKSDMAMVVNELGNLTGMVQIDDVITELVKFASSDMDSAQPQVRMVGLGQWEVPGRLAVRDWQEYFEPAADDTPVRSRVSTVAGLILSRLGRVPKVGDEMAISNMRLRVESLSGRNIERVSVRLSDVAMREQERDIAAVNAAASAARAAAPRTPTPRTPTPRTIPAPDERERP
jgi:putative hemolysin